MFNRSFMKSGVAAAVLAVAAGACDDSTSVPATADIDVLLTDAASDYVSEAMVDIGAVELLGGQGGPIVLTEDGTDGLVNLLDFQNEATAILASTEIPTGTYTQLRLIVEEATVTLAEGYEFNGGGNSMELTVPSGAQTGIKLNLSAADDEATQGGVEISGDMVLVVDFDVNQSFVIQGSPDTAAGINSVSFQPTLRVVVSDIAGSISGVVSLGEGVEGLPVQGLVVSAEPVEGTTLEPYQSMTGTAVVDETGAYTIFFLVPGDYDVSVEVPEGYTSDPVVDVTVGEDEDVVDVDLLIGQS
jgi:hypothetical protein